jgi:hypothetical protein
MKMKEKLEQSAEWKKQQQQLIQQQKHPIIFAVQWNQSTSSYPFILLHISLIFT